MTSPRGGRGIRVARMPTQVQVVVFVALVLYLVTPVSACTPRCVCEEASGKVTCESISNRTLHSVLSSLPSYTKEIHVSNSAFRKPMEAEVLGDVKHLENVGQVTIDYCQQKFTQTEFEALEELPNLEELGVNFCMISRLSPQTLHSLSDLVALDLSHNGISHIEEHAFSGMKNLKVLILHNNTIDLLPANVFQNLELLEIVDLNKNVMTHFHPVTFSNLTALETIYLEHNQIETLHQGSFYNTSNSVAVYMKGNRWDCNCGLLWLMSDLASPNPYTDLKRTLKHWDKLTCHNPEPPLSGLPLYKAKEVLVECTPPQLDVYPEDVEILTMQSWTLNCSASGFPEPCVYWKTPLGILAHPTHRKWLHSVIPEHKHSLWYAGMPTYYNSTITALANGSLVIEQFRYYFAGEYDCVAVNPVGMESAGTNVTIQARINHHMLFSIIVGFGSCFAFLLIGIFVGAMRMCAEKTCRCCKEQGVYKPNITFVVDTPYGQEHIDYDYEFDYSPFSDGTWPRFTPFLPHWSPYASPKKCVTPAEETYEDERDGNGYSIKDTLEDVRYRLKQGIERASGKIRTGTLSVKENTSKKLQTIKDSTSHKMQTIRESGTMYVKNISKTTGDYAHRVRVGVALGVHQVKSQVQSVKELCGAGNLAQTVSVATVTEGPNSASSKTLSTPLDLSMDQTSTSVITEAIQEEEEESPTGSAWEGEEEDPENPVAGPSSGIRPVVNPPHVYISYADDSDACSDDEMFPKHGTCISMPTNTADDDDDEDETVV